MPASDSMWKKLTCHASLRALCRRHVVLISGRVKQSVPATASCLTWARDKSSSAAKHQHLYDILQKMPKHIDLKGLQQQRLARKRKSLKYPPSTVYLQVLGSGAVGAPRSLYVFTEHARYLFNCGEGTQRLAHEHKVKLATMEHILVTHKSWENVGGLPGVLLTLQDTGVPYITLHGPPGIESIYYDTRHFLRFRDLTIQYKHYLDTGEPNTEPLIIQNVPIWAKVEEMGNGDASEKLESVQGTNDEVEDLYAHEKPESRKRPNRGRQGSTSPTLKRQRQEESVSCRNLSVAYICRPPPKAGALKLEECVRAGVPPGPLLGDLKKGIDITLSDGTLVKAADVTEPDDPGPVFIVVEAPSEAYLDSLLESPAFKPYQPLEGSDNDLAEVVVHFTPQKVLAHPRYQEWMARFSLSTSHIIINESNTCMGSVAVHRIQYKLNLLNDNIFPLLKDGGIPVKETDGDEKVEETNNEERSENSESNSKEMSLKINEHPADSNPYVVGPTMQSRTLFTYHIRPRKKTDGSNELYLYPDTYMQECYIGEKFESAFLDIKDKLQAFYSEQAANTCSQDYPQIIFLGTGSCIPNKTRNTSSILLDISSDKALIMDCGEGTYGQMVRLLGAPECEKMLRKLVAVYVSHLHADHHIGFIRLLHARRKAFHAAGVFDVPKLLLMAPGKIMPYLISYNANFEPLLQDFTHVYNQKLLYKDFTMEEDDYKKLCSMLDMKKISMTHVLHCPNSFGVAWTHNDGWKIVYSGDTMPCKGLVEIGQDCDVLIHEATMEDELEEDAKLKTHSTTSQAIQVGKDMNARQTLLTHFSQRYAKVPLLDELPLHVGIAFDNMKVCQKDFPSLHLLYEVLVAMFSEDYDGMLEKTAKKRLAREKIEAHMKSKEEM